MKISRAVTTVIMTGALLIPAVAQTAPSATTKPHSQHPVTQPKNSSELPKRIGTGTRAQAEIGSLLREFLSKVDDPAMHERFWADDLIYVGAGGKVRTKDEIVNAVKEEAQKKQSGEAKSEAGGDKYSAEDVTIRQYGDTAVLNFRLVAQDAGGKQQTFRNSGTFVKNDEGQWQAVSWQATREGADAAAASTSKGDKKPTGKD